jgi:2-dehydropantoate 2-reductase
VKVCVVGAGTIGATIGARLSAAGEQVSLVARGEHLQAISRNGLELIDRVGTWSGTYRLPASDEPSAFGPQDLVLIAVKAHALRAVLGRLDPLTWSEARVVAALNGRG